MKKRLTIILSVIVVCLLVTTGILFYIHSQQRFNIQQNVGKGDASTQPILTRNALFNQFKGKYDSFSDMIDAPQGETANNADFFTIPGLAGAWSYNNKTKKVEYGKSWDPQGISASDDQIFISAYDSQKKLNSVIFVINKKTGNYQKTIVLNGRYHVGSIAYDTTGQNLWISTDTTTQARLSMLTQAQLDKADIETDNKPVAFTTSDTLTGVSHTSALNISDNQIFVGVFSASNASKIVSFTFAGNGRSRHLIDTGKPISGIQAKIQGITSRNDKIVLTSSYGNFPSKIQVYQAHNANGKTTLAFEKTITLPPYAEEVHFDGDRVLILFESGATKYRNRASMVIDRVISLKASDFMKIK